MNALTRDSGFAAFVLVALVVLVAGLAFAADGRCW
jgi:hypothetical protein